ncbi:hypothetical protein INR49_001410 [Caranx melampygus]|nr:hypothetical protein INR49_001410 [Caranx melampygus]
MWSSAPMKTLWQPCPKTKITCVVVAVVTMATQEGAEARGAAGCEVHTDEVIPLFKSILAFVSRLLRPHLLS